MKNKKEICVLNKDNTYQFISNDDMTVLSYAKRDKSKYIFFPVYNKDGVKYYRENANVIMSPIQIKLDGTLLVCDFNDSGVSFKDAVPISLVANSIAESYSLLGSLYTLEHCCEVLETTNLQLKPELFEFDIVIYVDGCKYHLNHDLYTEISKSLNNLETIEEDYAIDVVPIYSIIGYIENTISYKMSDLSSSYNNPNFILFPNGECLDYNEFKTRKINPPDNSALLASTGSSLYVSLSYLDYKLMHPDNANDTQYVFEYVIFDTYGSDDDIQNDECILEEDLSCHVILELESYMYEVYMNDQIPVYTDTEFIFLLTSINDISEVLILFAAANINICYTCAVSIGSDHSYQPVIMESITRKIADTVSTDLLDLLTRHIIAIESGTKEQLK